MYSFISDFLGWDKDFYDFTRAVHDNSPYKIYREEDEVTIAHNILGIDEKDLSLRVENEDCFSYLVISGKSNDGYSDYCVDSRFAFDAEKYEKIDYTIKNGILYITLLKKVPNKPEISINRV